MRDVLRDILRDILSSLLKKMEIRDAKYNIDNGWLRDRERYRW